MKPGERFPDLNLPDHNGHDRTLPELAGGDPGSRCSPRADGDARRKTYMRLGCQSESGTISGGP